MIPMNMYVAPNQIQSGHIFRICRFFICKMKSPDLSPFLILLNIQEVNEDLLLRLTTLLSSQLPNEVVAAQQKSYVTYTIPRLTASPEQARLSDELNPGLLTLHESRSLLFSSGTTGLRTWEAALHLGTYLSLDSSLGGGRSFIEKKNILELGAGPGFVSLLCAKFLGAREVLATDGDDRVVEDVKTNAFLNDLQTEGGKAGGIESFPLIWGRALSQPVLEDKDENPRHWDLVIGSDVVS
jgi:protein-lysine N-methyltransferase EEF2KMT